MNVLVVDVETTIFEKGNPFSICNKLCYVGLYDGNQVSLFDIEYSPEPYADKLQEIKRRIEEADCIVCFNGKFDINWLRRYIPDLGIKKVYDCQLHEFIVEAQQNRYPSLNDSLTKRGLPNKISTIESNYWNQGINTDKIPRDELEEYLTQDLISTYLLFKDQYKEYLVIPQKALIDTSNEDLLILQEMEFNGLPYFDEDEAIEWSKKLEQELETNRLALDACFNVSCPINWDSPAQVSAILYGGTIKTKARIPTSRELKDGTVKQGEKWGVIEQQVKGIVRSPLKNGKISVNEDTLLKIDWGIHKKVRDLLLLRRELSKLMSTYLLGLVELRSRRDWPKNHLYPTYNQCKVVTGRLASKSPNGQNIPLNIRRLFKAKGD